MRITYIILVALSMLAIIPSLMWGLNLAVHFDNMVWMPVPAVVVSMLAGWFGYKVEESA